MRTYLDFEKPIAELEGKIADLRQMDGQTGVNVAEEISKLQSKADSLLADSYGKLTRWQKAQVARHAARPHSHTTCRNLLTTSRRSPAIGRLAKMLRFLADRRDCAGVRSC